MGQRNLEIGVRDKDKQELLCVHENSIRIPNSLYINLKSQFKRGLGR